jgi:hypothetical protein
MTYNLGERCELRNFTPYSACHDHRSLRLPTEPSPEEEARRGFSVRQDKRPYGVISDDGMPDEARRTELIRQFMERTLRGENDGSAN